MKIDLHLHTTFSDGKLSPEELVRNAHENHYSFISITDHDTFAGYLEARDYMKNKNFNLELIPGVEVSTIFENNEVHILAYYFDETNEDLIELLKQVYDSRYGRALEMVEKLKSYNIELDWTTILSYAGKNKYIGRPHIARAMITNGAVKTIREAFDRFLHNESPVYVPKLKVETEYAINTIKRAGGISVLAHPGRLSDDSIVYNCIDMGIDGLEVYYVSHITGQTRLYEQIALENNLVRTGGTDFHGNEFYFVNYSAPEICINDLKTLHEKRKLR